MRWMAIAVVLAAVGCGGTEPVPPTDPATASAEVLSLGRPCVPGEAADCAKPRSGVAGSGTICGSDRFGFTCVAYCSDTACQEPGTVCMPRIGSPPDATGFCWKACARDGDCASSLRCRDGVCGPR